MSRDELIGVITGDPLDLSIKPQLIDQNTKNIIWTRVGDFDYASLYPKTVEVNIETLINNLRKGKYERRTKTRKW